MRPDFRTRENPAVLRAKIGDAIERLIAILDSLDGDENCEDDAGGEPYLGWPAIGPHAILASANNDDHEIEDEHSGDIQDEPHDDVFAEE